MSNAVKRERIKEHWESYRKILPKNASANQIMETRRAFYAGAETTMIAILTMLDPGEEATDADLTKMDDLQKEIQEFVSLVKNGVA